MSVFNFKTAALAIAAGVGLSGCAYGPYGGLGVGVGYGSGYGYGYDDYYDPYYGGGYYGAGYNQYGYGYGQPYYGWYDGYYYPGTGYYVYDRYRRPHRWSDTQRRYWEWRQRGARTSSGSTTSRILDNWADFQQGPRAVNRVDRQRAVQQNQVRREVTAEQRAAWTERRQATAEQRAAWAERRQQAAEQRASRRASRAETQDEPTTERRVRRGRNRD